MEPLKTTQADKEVTARLSARILNNLFMFFSMFSFQPPTLGETLVSAAQATLCDEQQAPSYPNNCGNIEKVLRRGKARPNTFA